MGCVPSLLFDLRPSYGGGNEDDGTSFKSPMHTLLHSMLRTLQQATVNPHLCQRLLNTPGHLQASLAQSLVGSLFLSPGSWCAQSFVSALQESVSPVLWKSCNQNPLDVWITTNWKILEEIGIPGHLTCLLRNLYAGQKATVSH